MCEPTHDVGRHRQYSISIGPFALVNSCQQARSSMQQPNQLSAAGAAGAAADEVAHLVAGSQQDAAMVTKFIDGSIVSHILP